MGLSQVSSALPSSSFYMNAFILLLSCGLFVTSVAGGNNETDRLALLEFKGKIIVDPFRVMHSWNDSIHFCRWRGVICGRQHQRVTVLHLQSLKLVGSISPHIGNLSFLRILTLYNNSFHNEIPEEIGNLRRLQVIQLDNNTLSGKIPSNLSACTSLFDFRVSHNLLVGEIPKTLGTWLKLRYLALYHNNLTGSIPPFGNLSLLEAFSLAENNLGGIIPDSFGQLTKLFYFSVESNRLSGIIPPSMFNQSSLTSIDVGLNQIQGSLPLDIGNTLPNIQFFSISENQFTGSIPVSISNASNLIVLQLSQNKLRGEVPSLEKLNRVSVILFTQNNLGNGGGGVNDLSFLCSLTNSTYLIRLHINTNNFGGELPKCIGSFSTTLTKFVLDGNKVSGKIPTEIGNLTNLQRLDMWDNKLSGNIPSEIGNLKKLHILALNTNNFSGKIPPSIGNLTSLIQLYLFENNLMGNIPLSLSKCGNLFILNLASNNLSGSIFSQVIGLSFLPTFLDLSSNQFTGVLPKEIGQFINLEELDISGNTFFGKIPASLGSCVKLEFLGMGRNLFQGTIPPSLESLKGLRHLDLSSNNLSGQIPKFLEVFLFLQYLNLSYNLFEGEVPINGVFKNTSATFIKGNSKLCGGIPKFQLPKCKYEKSRRNLTLTMKLIISIFSGLLGVTLVLSLVLLCSLRKKRIQNTLSDSRNLLSNLSYQSLLNATNGFSSTNLIGVGSFGSVYKGILNQGRQTVAIKVLNLLRHGASKSFIAECEALRNIRHRNLLKVLTACSSIDYQGQDFKALVYEFMANGNLDEWLHPTSRIEEALEEPRNLSLLQRLNIVIDVANALDYLHHHCQTPIIHCDLKPSNVLLDDDMIAHVGDFGLAKLLFDATQDCSIDQPSSIGIRGTIGYAPPEYGVGNEVSTYGDVYSYGILLLETFTGKRPTDNIFQDSVNLHDFVKVALPERIIDIVDPILLWERDVGETEMNNITRNECQIGSSQIQECLILILGIGVACSVEFPRERMNMSAVIIELHSIRQKLLGSNIRRQRLQATSKSSLSP